MNDGTKKEITVREVLANPPTGKTLMKQLEKEEGTLDADVWNPTFLACYDA
jgi:hypothetical protein